jgi:ATP-binding cassette subfamily C (CFTR/MRP) protein 1
MEKGDLTIVGEKGITLSGGQRARVSLARAIYARADLTLLDDTLAALDSHVGRHVFDHVIGPNGLLASKARILVTHSVAHVRHFDKVMFVRRGIILDQGTPAEVLANRESELSKLIRGHGGTLTSTSSGVSTPNGNENVADEEETLAALSESSEEANIQEKTSATGVKERRKSYGRAVVLSEALPVKISEGMSKEHSEKGVSFTTKHHFSC